MFRDAQGVAAFKDLCIHRGAALSLGWIADGPVIHAHDVRQSEFMLEYTYEDGDSRREYIVHSPFTVFIRKTGLPGRQASEQTWDRETTPIDGTTVLAQFNSPIDETRTMVFSAISRNHHLDMDDREFAGGDWFDTVLDQDRRVVESQRPERIPTDPREELHLKGPDATRIAYRRMLAGGRPPWGPLSPRGGGPRPHGPAPPPSAPPP